MFTRTWFARKGGTHLQQRVHAVVDGHVQAADFVHDGLGDDHVGEGAAAARAFEKVDLVENAVRVEDCVGAV